MNAWRTRFWRSFTSLWSGTDAALPALLLNGVHVATGKRIVTSNLLVSDIPLADTYDAFHDILEVDIPVSTAVHNSARFTYVSPAGTLRKAGTGEIRGRIVDDGYFENFGAATALETLVAVSDELKASGKNFRPFIIQISNDPKVEEFAPDAEPTVTAAPHEDLWCRNELISPACALLKTRDSRGTLAYKEFLEKANGGDCSHFRLCDKVPEPALGWVLARTSNLMMQEVVRDDRLRQRQSAAASARLCNPPRFALGQGIGFAVCPTAGRVPLPVFPGAPGRYGELAMTHFGEPGDAFPDHLLGGMGKAKAQPGLA
jgi:hypothetical protein